MKDPLVIRGLRWFLGSTLAAGALAVVVGMVISVNFRDVQAASRLFTGVDRPDIAPGYLIGFPRLDDPSNNHPLCRYAELDKVTSAFGPYGRTYFNLAGHSINTGALLDALLAKNGPVPVEIDVFYRFETLTVNPQAMIEESCLDETVAAIAEGDHVCVVSDVYRDVESEQIIGVRFRDKALNPVGGAEALDCAVASSGPLLWPLKRHLVHYRPAGGSFVNAQALPIEPERSPGL